MKLSNTDRIIINDLFKATEGLFIYTLYSRYKFSPKDIFESINKLETEGIIHNADDRISLTKAGVDFAIAKHINYKENKSDKHMPVFCNGPKIEINEFYIPLDFEK